MDIYGAAPVVKFIAEPEGPIWPVGLLVYLFSNQEKKMKYEH